MVLVAKNKKIDVNDTTSNVKGEISKSLGYYLSFFLSNHFLLMLSKLYS
jgi:hypothetical protein